MLRFTRIAIWFIGFRWLLSIVFMAEADETLFIGITGDISGFEKGVVDELAKASEEAQKAGKKAGKATDEVGKLGDEMAKTGGKAKGFGDSAKKAGDGAKGMGDGIGKATKNTREFVEVMDKAGNKVKAFRDKSGKLRDESGKFLKGFSEQGEKGGASILKMGAAFGVAAAAGGILLNTIVNIASAAINAAAGLIQSGIQINAQFEEYETQFTTLLGSSEKAKQKLIELEQFGVETPFELPEIIEASKALQTAGQDALNTQENLRLVGDAASAVGQPFEGVAMWTGRMYDSLKNGRPFGEAAARMAEMNIITGETRNKLEQMQKAGAEGNEVWETFVEEGLGKFEGGMDKLSKTFKGVTSNLADFQGKMIRIGGEAVFTAVSDGANEFLGVLDANTEGIEKLSTGVGEIVGMVASFASDELFGFFNAERVDGFVEALGGAIDWLKNIVDGVLDAIRIAKVFGAEYLKAIAPLAKFEFKAIKTLIGWILTLIKKATPLGMVFDMLGERIKAAGGFMNALQQAFITGAQIFGLVGAGIKGLIALFSPLLTALGAGAKALGAFLTLDFKGAMEAGKEGLAALKDGVTDTDGALKVMKESLLETDKNIKQGVESTKDLKEEMEDATDATEGLEDATDEIEGPTVDTAAQKKLEGFSDQLIDATENRNKQLEDLEKSHADKIKSITENAAKQRLDIEEKANKALIDNDKQSEKQRLKIIDDARKSLSKLAKDTDSQINEKRDSFQKDELRDTEDHMREMRKLTDKFLNDLEGAVRDRDAGAIVDLQRGFNAEKSERESDFNLKRGRGKEDQDQELDGLRKAESDKREEILESQAEQLSNLQKDQEDRRTKILEDKDMALAALEEKLAEDLMKEQENYEAKQQQLDEALKKKLESIAEAMAKEKDITEEGAQAVLEALNEKFGIGGDIDKMMEKFVSRRTLKAEIDISFKKKSGVDTDEGSDVPPPTAAQAATQAIRSGQAAPGGRRLGGIQAFGDGGTLVANKPTLALFGEKKPEIAQFTPISDISSGGNADSESKVLVEFSGSAPPGIGGADRDKIASVVVSALRETGVLS